MSSQNNHQSIQYKNLIQNYDTGGLAVVTERGGSGKATSKTRAQIKNGGESSMQNLIRPYGKENVGSLDRPQLKPSMQMMNRRFPKPTLVNSSVGKGAIAFIKKDNLSTAKTQGSSQGFLNGTKENRSNSQYSSLTQQQISKKVTAFPQAAVKQKVMANTGSSFGGMSNSKPRYNYSQKKSTQNLEEKELLKMFGGSKSDLQMINSLMTSSNSKQISGSRQQVASHTTYQKPPIFHNSSKLGQKQKTMRSDGFQHHSAHNPNSASVKKKFETAAAPHQFENLGKVAHNKNDADIQVEKALIELNEVRNDLIISQGEAAKPPPASANTMARTFAGGLTTTSFNNARNTASPLLPNSAQFNNTAGSFYKEGSLLGDMDSMTTEQLKERLVIAETLMKKLYNRNKDVELYHKQKVAEPTATAKTETDNDAAGTEKEEVHELDIIAEFKKREEKMTQELKELHNEIQELKTENQELIKNSMPNIDLNENNKNSHLQKYTKFLEKRIQECMLENKRYLAKYSDLRSFAYTQIENLVKKNELQAKGRRSITSNTASANNLNIYKNLIEKERKQWQDERQRKEDFISDIQSKVLQMSNQMEYMQHQMDSLESEQNMREECEAKVNQYVQELIQTNKEQAEQLKFIKENRN